jgi:hypothetical protein
LDALRQRFTWHELEHQKARITGLLKIVKDSDVRVIQRSQNFRLSLESAHARRIARKFIRQDLDCNFTLQLGITRAIHLSHAALAQQCDDFMGSELSSNDEAH